MTTVVYSPGDGLVSLRGHAGAGEKGRDPVCAALSILTYTLAALPGAGLRLGEGWAVVALPPGAPAAAVCRGFALLAAAYPQNVCYKEVKP